MHEIFHFPGHQIRRLHQISQALYRERMARIGVDLTSVQYAALSVLAERPGIDQAALATTIAYDKVTIGGVVDRLEAKGLVHRVPSATDRRRKVLSLTAAGERMLARTRPDVLALQDDILANLGPAERERFVDLLTRLTGAFDPAD